MKKNNNKSKFILGALFGAVAGILFAPKSGKETRKVLKIKAEDLINKAKEIDVIEVKDTITSKTQEIIDEIKELDKEKVLKIAKKKAEEFLYDTCEQEAIEYYANENPVFLEKHACLLRDGEKYFDDKFNYFNGLDFDETSYKKAL